MQTARRKREQQITGPHAARVQNFLALDGAHDESRQVVIAGRVDVGHFSCFAADQRAACLFGGAAHALDHLLEDARVQLAHRNVVEEKKRLGALRENVVHAVVHDVRADRGMNACGAGNFQLRAHSVAARHQHRVAPAFPVELKE